MKIPMQNLWTIRWAIDQVWDQDGWIMTKFFFCLQDGVEVHKLAKKERGQYPAILTEHAWYITDLLLGLRTQQVIPSGQDGHLSRLGSQSQHKFRFILPAHGASHIIREILI